MDKNELLDEHFVYEVDMLVSTYLDLVKLELRDHTAVEKNILIEEVLLHSRCLFDFLCYDNPNKKYGKTDALAVQFSSAWKLNKMNKENKTELDKLDGLLKPRSGWEIFHLTYNRKKIPMEKVWDLPAIYVSTLKLLLSFLEGMEKERVFFSPKLAELKKRLSESKVSDSSLIIQSAASTSTLSSSGSNLTEIITKKTK
jgi:hypothetical protein